MLQLRMISLRALCGCLPCTSSTLCSYGKDSPFISQRRYGERNKAWSGKVNETEKLMWFTYTNILFGKKSIFIIMLLELYSAENWMEEKWNYNLFMVFEWFSEKISVWVTLKWVHSDLHSQLLSLYPLEWEVNASREGNFRPKGDDFHNFSSSEAG